MIQRISLFVASLAAAGVLAVGLAVAGVGQTAPDPAATSAASAADPAPTPRVQVDTVYVAAPAKPKTVVVHKTVAPTGGEHETESEGEGD